jgi:hypothetical protein
MAIKIKLPAKKGASNKPHITPKSSIGTTGSQPKKPIYQHELKPFIDWLTINITPPDKDQHDIHDAFWTAVNDKDVLADALSAEKKGAGYGFNIAKRLVLPSIADEKKHPTLFVRHLKEQKRIAKLRLTLVPVDLGVDGMLELHVAINMIVPDGWEYVVTHGRVTRIDVAVDLPGLTMDSIHFLPKKAAHTQRWFPNGELETIYIGKPKGNQTAIYDRSKKRAKKKQEVPQGLRIEHRGKTGSMKLSNLPTMKNPLAGTKLFVALPGPQNPAKEKEWSMFSDSVEKRGLSAALALLPKDRRAAYKKHINAHQLSAWNPDEIWKGWQPMLDEMKIASPHW